MHSEGRYSLQELAERGGVPVRTIRYYTTQGLLPPPLSRGRYAAYTEAHLNRLRLIGKLKRAYLPLPAIRAQLEGLTDAQVEALAAYTEASDAPSGQPPKAKPSVKVKTIEPARDPEIYVAQILTVTGQAPPPTGKPAGPPRRALLVSPALRGDPAQGDETPSEQVQEVASEEDTWRRFTVAPGVELHLRLPLSPALESRLPEVIDDLRRRLQPP
jgi:DNA-binding transcriptional MerR regulator